MAKQQKPKTTKISWKAIVEKLWPDRHKRKVAYRFSNGREFKEK
jgi:hypothetical protein